MGLVTLAERALSLLPANLGRALYQRAFRVVRVWRAVVPGQLSSCFVAIGNREQHILLVRHSYRDTEYWTLPGGRMWRGESPIDAARREVREELACDLTDLELKGYFHWVVPPQDIEGYVFTALTDDCPQPDLREISEARFFPLDDLPSPLFDFARERIEDLRARTARPIVILPFVRTGFVEQNPRRYT